MTWQQIPGTSYAASECGQIKNLVSGKIIQPVVRGCGYAAIHLHGRQQYVHRMVLYAFTGYLGEQCNHKDLHPLNNRLENLEWVTSKENIQHYLRSLVTAMESAGQMRLTL